MPNPWIVIKLGGSLLSPKKATNSGFDLFDFTYTNKLLTMLHDEFKQFSFALVVGGGHVNQLYLDELKRFASKQSRVVSEYYQNHIGIAAIDLHAHVVLALASTLYLPAELYPEALIYTDFKRLPTPDKLQHKRLLIAGADRPGHSSDYNAYQLATHWGATMVISLKDIDGVYDSDPRQNPQAKKIDSLTWKEYSQITRGVKYAPRSHYPVDVVTAPLAAKADLSYIIMSGKNLSDVRAALQGERIAGTVIYP